MIHRLQQVWVWVCCCGVCCAMAGCSAYDANLLQLKVRSGGSHGGTSGAGSGTGGARSVLDASATIGSTGSAVRMDRDSDSGSPNEFPLPDGGPKNNPTRCGDGQVTGAETCDTGIKTGQPGACPTEADCPSLGMCATHAINNQGTCQATCIALQGNCKGGDGCCPSNCTHANDSDCSGSCHDGVVQPEKGETCEPGSATAPCKTVADCDDKDPCTMDTITGSPDNCNVECAHTAITMPMDGDGCCPAGANNNTDKDCAPRCGNGVPEAGEVCDGSSGCSSDCSSSSAPVTDQPTCPEIPCTQPCFPVGLLPCCNPLHVCGCTWAPGAYCL
jgi:hypothetical protein